MSEIIYIYYNQIFLLLRYAPIYTENADELRLLGELAANAIGQASTIGSNYVVENSAVLLYAAAGAGDDWAKGGAGIELAFTVELPDGGLPFYFIFTMSVVTT